VEKKGMEDVIHSPRLDDDFNKGVLSKLTPYIQEVPKHRTWKYQLGVIGVVAAIFFVSVVVVPSLKPLANKVATFIEYGTIYNVWTEGTYKVTDNEMAFEVKSVEIDPLHMVVYYEISGDGLNVNNDNDFDFYENNAVQIIDEDGNKYPVEVSQPITGMFYRNQQDFDELDEELTRPSFVIRATDEEDLPDEFSLRFHFKRIQGRPGNWEIDVPIHYEKIEGKLEVVKLDQVMVIDDKIEIEFLSMIYGSYGSRLTYHVRLKEEEKKRIDNLLEEVDSDTQQMYSPNYYHVYAGVQVVNRDNQYMMPIYYNSYMMGTEMDMEKPIQQDFSRFYFDRQFYEIKGKEEEFSQYFAELHNVEYNEPAFISIPIPLEETDNTSLDVDLDGITLKQLSVEIVDGGSTDNKRYKVIITAEKNHSQNQKQYHWNFAGENGEHVETHYIGHYDPYSEENPEEFELLNVEIQAISDNTKTITLQALGAYNMYMFDEGEKKIPLFKE
jgi:HSP20 family molecular chaperone IbpA